MKNIFCYLALLILGHSLNAQVSVPSGIAYQAVAIKPNVQGLSGTNVDGLYWTNRDIAVRFTIYDKWPGGNNEYSETHDLKTDAFGTFSCVVGQGTPITGSFSNISWDLGTAHLQVEIDYHRNGQFTLIGVERFWSVPYSLVSNESLKSTEASGYTKSQIDSMTNILLNQIQYLKNRDKDTAIGNDGVSMSYVDSQMNKLISLYNSVKASDKDTVVGNEIQQISMSNDSIVLSRNGGGVLLMDDDPKNEIQTLSLQNDTLILSNGGGSVDLGSIVESSTGSTITTSVRAASTSSRCFSGVLINLESWGNSSGYNFVWPVGEIADSVFVFKGDKYGNNVPALFLHDIRSNKISKIRDIGNNNDWNWTGDSVLYIGDPSGTVQVFHYQNGKLDSITNFSGGPSNGNYYFQKVIVNKSKDLIWIGADNKGLQTGTIYKFQYSTRTLKTYTNPASGKSYGTVSVVSGDSVLLGTRLVNSSNMNTISDITDLQNAAYSRIGVVGNKIFYLVSNGGSGLTMAEYNIENQKKYTYGAVSSWSVVGVNNNELWFEIKMGGGSMSGIPVYNLGNLGLIGDVPVTCSVLANGIFVSHGYSPAVSLNVIQDTQGRLMGGIYQLSNITSEYCVNNSLYRWDLGYFYSK